MVYEGLSSLNWKWKVKRIMVGTEDGVTVSDTIGVQ